jgi:hypothetical protein
MKTAEQFITMMKKKLGQDLEQIGSHPDHPEFWQNYTLKKIEGLDTSREIYIRVSAQKDYHIPEELIAQKAWVYTPTWDIYRRFREDGYELISLHPKSKTPCLLRIPSEEVKAPFSGPERREHKDSFPPPLDEDWFLPPE